MFERYTERARRVLFFSRYEAMQTGAVSIEADHLLLGLVREREGLAGRVLSRAHGSLDTVRSEVERRRPSRSPAPPSLEIPFSAEVKHILVFAAEEADRLGHRDIDTVHLLLGILREEDSATAVMLVERGLRLESVRRDVAQSAQEGLSRDNALVPAREDGTTQVYTFPVEFRIGPATSTVGISANRGLDRWTFEGFSLRHVLSDVLSTQPGRVELPAGSDEAARYDIRLDLPLQLNPDAIQQLMLRGLSQHFQIEVTSESRPTDVYVLTAPVGAIAAVKISDEGGGGLMSLSYAAEAFDVLDVLTMDQRKQRFLDRMAGKPAEPGRDSITGISGTSTMEGLAGMLGSELGRPVLDETNVKGTYEFNVQTDARDTETFLQIFSERTGVVVSPDRRDLMTVVVRPRRV